MSLSFSPVVPQPCLNVPVLSEFLRGVEGHCRVWLQNEMNQIPDQLIESLFHGQISSSSSSSAVPQSRSTVSELCELLKGKKVELSRVMRGEMDRVLNDLFEGLTNKLMAYSDLDRSEDGGVGARVKSNDLEVWKPRLFTEEEIKNEFEYGNVDELLAELGLPTGDQQQQTNIPNTQQQFDDETNNNGGMMQIEEEDGDGEMNVNEMEQLAANQNGGDESRRMENAPMDTTPKRKRQVPQARNRVTNRDNQAVEGDEGTGQNDEVSSRHVKRPRIHPTQPNLTQSNRRLQCSHCHKSFDHKSTLQRHLRVHTGERPFQCDECDQRFNLKGSLARHQLVHQNIGNFQCPECDKKFTRKDLLDSHLRTHSGERPFACRHCEMSFARLIDRHNHEQAIHLHVKPYRCKQCGHTATVRSNIIAHIREVHFGLLRSTKEQRELNIVVDRDPRELMEKV